MGKFTYGWLAIAYLAIGTLALIVFGYFNPPNLSLEHLSSPYVKVFRMGDTPGHGLGTYLGNGYILTANHVVVGAESELEVVTEDGRRFKAKVKSQSENADTAVLKIDPKAPITAKQVSCRLPVVGEAVTVIGNPYMLEWIRFKGFVAGLPRELSVGMTGLKGVMILDLTAAPGVSGASVLDISGRIIGIIAATLTVNGVSMPVVMSISSSLFCEVLKDSGAI